MMNPRLLNVGGNNKAIAIPPYYAEYEHLIVDIDPAVKPDLLMDARELSKSEPDSYDAIYCSHNLEHYFAHDVPKVLGGFRHILKPDGFVEIRVPDLKALMNHLVKHDLELDDELYKTQAGHTITARDVFYGWGQEIERSGVDFYAHKTGFTQSTLRKALNAAGFSVIVFRPGRLFEIMALAFVQVPDSNLQRLLDLKIDA